ncbi:IPT/TIG domain-containing protein [Ideonella sp. BN130291]|uniref:IPT/TIG domain-containing protein n=1 Tax=Ideonella sp. BN130291 TaxID=3112940 RepID=UPI002E25957E|nr:IPT/TIG domain-containing protein [Ideonella sp. BN130291]
MATVQDLLNQLCETCRVDYDPAFIANPRLSEVIAGDLHWPHCCFVRDEIQFLNGGRLIFDPLSGDGRQKNWCPAYFVICRKLVIAGGKPPGSHDPCGSDDPGQEYAGNNVITWADRLKAAPAGPAHNPAGAAMGTSFDINVWSGSGNPNGNNGADAGAGVRGADGNPGGGGASAPGSDMRDMGGLTIVALEIEFTGPGAHLTIDWDGQTGGDGGIGQDGGDGGNGMGGRDGESDTSWPGEGCDRAPGGGGRGGNGGDGGTGGKGGRGGNAGNIFVISPHGNISSGGGFVGGQITFVNDGGSGGAGGKSGRGGRAGHGGKPGNKTSLCDPANSGPDGADGFPPITLTGSANIGSSGDHGDAKGVKFLDIVDHPCTRDIPLPVVVSTIAPDHVCRGFASAASTDITVTGQHLLQVSAVQPTLAGATATIKPTSTDTQLNLKLDVTGGSALGASDLVFKRAFGADFVKAAALTVGRFAVASVAPATGARNSNVAVTITGTCFDNSAAVQKVDVSGSGVSVMNVIVVNETTITCVIEIANLAATGARNLTVTTGSLNHTLLNAFTIT